MTYLDNTPLPNFNTIKPLRIKQQFKKLLKNQHLLINELLVKQKNYTFENLMMPLEALSVKLSEAWSPISHLHAVKESDSLRQAYKETLPLLTEFHTALSQNKKLYDAILQIKNSENFNALSAAQQKIIDNDLRNFKLSGVHLSKKEKSRSAFLQKELSDLTTIFSEHVLDATSAFYLHFRDNASLMGLPKEVLKLAEDNAKQRDLSGYVLTLDYPSYSTAIRFLKDRALRQKLYEAYVTRASEVGPNGGQFDNSDIMQKILAIRHELANLVGYENYATYSLATKMAKTPNEVLIFLRDLAKKSRQMAEAELKSVREIAFKEDQITSLMPWDIPYYSEKLQESLFQFNAEDLRPYFPITQVLQGLFHILKRLFGLHIEEKKVAAWHRDTKFFAIYDDAQQLRGGVYMDLYARPHKREGAWMDECHVRQKKENGKEEVGIAYLTCNFMPPLHNQEALLTHEDVITLFHEFGHCLHHILTKVVYPSVGGISGVAWDAVEFPSQFLENFCWQKESLAVLAKHVETGMPLPDALYHKMVAAKNFQTGLQMLRQLEFALFDFHLHLDYDPVNPKPIQAVLNSIREEIGVVPIFPLNRFQHTFSHIFAGSYAAGYYSYKWAEVLSQDAYEQFEEEGLFDKKTGLRFMQTILEVGGVADPMSAFIAFRGRPPHVDALLRTSGILLANGE